MKLSRTRRALAGALALSLLAPTSAATWSIVAVDTATGEVVVAGATCLPGFDLLAGLPVVRVGVGGAAAQSLIDQFGGNRKKIWDGFIAGDTPQQILDLLKATDGDSGQRQYGIVDMLNTPVKFTGLQVLQAKKALVGQVGTIRYAMQGNVLTGTQVILDAEAKFLAKQGDLGERVLAGMLAARNLGGDGRCSCDFNFPTSCGVPPPSFKKSAEVAFFVIARMGDSDGVCDGTLGCANGDYYLSLNVTFSPATKDPVNILRTQYTNWRAALAGVPDGVLSTAEAGAQSLVADGASKTAVRLELFDVEGDPVVLPDASTLAVTPLGGAPGVLAAGPIVAEPDGSFSFDVAAGTATGQTTFVVTHLEGSDVVTLYPYTTVRADPVAPLHAGFDEVSAADGALVPFTVHGAPSTPFLLLGSLSGTSPGLATPFGNLPLNPDPFFDFTLLNPGHALLPGSFGVTDPGGRGEAGFDAPAGLLAALVGGRLDWAVVFLGAAPSAGPAVGFDVLP